MNQSPRLLVVDDEKDIGEFISFVASNKGYEVTSIDDPNAFKEWVIWYPVLKGSSHGFKNERIRSSRYSTLKTRK